MATATVLYDPAKLGKKFRQAWNRHDGKGGGTPPHWKDILVKPLVEALVKAGGYDRYEIGTPAGISATLYIDLYKGGEKFYFAVRPGHDLNAGHLNVVDFSRNTGEFKTNTIGELNGLNFPEVPITAETTADDLIKYLTKDTRS